MIKSKLHYSIIIEIITQSFLLFQFIVFPAKINIINIMKIFADNKRAFFNYQALEKFEAGIVLSGTEVKSIRNGKISLKGSYITFKNETPFLIGAIIPPYQPKNAPADYNPERLRRLLLNKSEIKKIMGKAKEKGCALVPLKIYDKNAIIKIEFAIAKSKKKIDKKEIIRKRESDRKINRALKSKL